VKIGETTSTYSTYLDETVLNENTYLYLVAAYAQGEWCFSNVDSSHPTLSRIVANYGPVIYSLPATSGTVGTTYSYDVQATEPNDDVLSYVLLTAPVGMTIDPSSGLIEWVPVTSGSFEVNVEVSDGKGGTDTQTYSITVTSTDDRTPPTAVTLQAPLEALAGQTIQLSGSAVDNVGILKILFFADGVQFGEDSDPPYQINYTIPESQEVGNQIIFHIQAVDLSDNRTDSSPAYTKIVSPGEGFIAGGVYDDSTGLPIPNTSVRLISAQGKPLGPPQETSTDHRGRFWFVAQEGIAALEVKRNGFVSSYREEVVQAGKVNYFFNSRITPLGDGSSINYLTGGNIFIDDNQITLYVPPGAFGENQSVTLNKLSSQGLPSPLPVGFTPLTAVHIGPENGALNSALELSIKGQKNLGGDVPSALSNLIAVYWDMSSHQWIRVAMSALPQDEGLLIAMSGMGTVALIRPDAQPVSPNIPEVGNPLIGVAPQAIPDGIVAEVIRSPEVLFMQPEARSNVHVKLKNIEPLSSGTRIEVDFDELYEKTDSTFLMPAPMTQDFILYQTQGAVGLESQFVASPSEIFDPVLLKEGIIHLTAHKPWGVEGSGIISLSGGTIISPEGFSILIPPGALNSPTPVLLKKLGDIDPVLLANPQFQLLGGVIVDLGGRGFSTSATLILTLSAPIAQDSQVLVIRTVMAGGVSRYELVGIAAVNGNTLTVIPNALGLPLPGIREEGRYYFLRMTSPVGYVTGQVSSQAGPVINGLVQENTLPLISLISQTKPLYVMASPLGAATILGKDLTNGNNASGGVALDAKDQIVSLDLVLSQSRPAVVSVTPNDGATGVQKAASITFKFSKPMDTSTINFSSVSLKAGANEVQGAISLLPDQITAVLQPSSLLADNTLYTLRLSTGIKDSFGQPLFGNQSDESFMTAFTTVDTTPPPRPEAGQIDIGSPVNGLVTISGTQGSVEPGVTVTVKNLKTGAMTSVVASNDGSFYISLQAGLIDNLQLILLDKSGNETAMNMGRAPPPEGFGVVGGAGGIVEGEGGIAAIIPAGVFPEDTIVSITPTDVSGLPKPFGPGMEGYIGGSVALNMGDIEIPDVMELVFSIKGYPQYTVTDRIPLFEVNRNFTLPQNLTPGTPLTLKITGRDKFGQSATLEVELPIVAVNPNTTPHTLTTQTMPVLKLTLPTEATPGQTIPIVAKAEPPDIKLRFPADPSLTGQEQIILYEVHEINGRTYYDLSTTASLVALSDGTKVIETNTPPYRGPRRSAQNLVAAIYRDFAIGFAQAMMPDPIELLPGGELFALALMAGEMDDLLVDSHIALFLLRKYSVPRPPDVSPYEFGVIPVPGGIPTRIQVFDLQTNNLIYRTNIGPIPPGQLSTSVIILGDDDPNHPMVTATTSFANNAVPLDAGISIGFTHYIDTATLTDNLYIEDEFGNRIDTEPPILPEDLSDIPAGSSYVVMLKPINKLQPGAKYTLIATAGIKRPADGPALASEFRLTFTTVSDTSGILNFVSIPNARSFDLIGNRALVAVSEPMGVTNGFKIVDLADPMDPQIYHGDQFDQGMLGRVRSIKGMKDANITTWNGSSITGDLAILSHGAPNVFSKIRYYDVNNPASPVKIGYTIVGASTEVLIECGDVQVIDTEYNVADIQVFDPCMNYVHGIPKVPAIPTVIDTDDQKNIYFINNGIGLMTIDLGRAIPYSHDRRGQAFGPSYLPADKVGGIVVTPRIPPLIPSQNLYLKIMSPVDLSFSTSPVVIEGEILSERVDKVFINGFRAEIQQVPGANSKFKAEIPIHEGVNQIIATGFGSQGENYGSVGIQLLRNYSANPLAGPGTVQISIPPLSVGGGNLSVTASVNDRVRFDQLFINGQLVSEKQCPPTERHPEIKDCGWNGSGTANIPLQPGVNSIVATAIDVDEYDPPLLGYADLRVEEGVALAAETGGVLEIFDASSLTRIKTLTMPPGKAFRISIAKGVMTDIDSDGRTGISENDDSDPTTVFDEIKNLAIIGGGVSQILTFVDITEPHNATVLGYINARAPPYRAWADSKKGIAYVAAGSEVLIVDITRPHLNPTLPSALWDQNNDGEDDRILKRIPISGKAIDIQVNKEKGLAYVLLEGTGIAILKLSQACAQDIGIDATRIPAKREVRYATLEKERSDLRAAIHHAMGHTDCSGFILNTNVALLAQGSSACIWREDGRCSTAYQPGISDYDFEFIVPDALLGAAPKCTSRIQKCIMGECDGLSLESVFEDVSVFAVPQSVFETFYRSVNPGINGYCGAEDGDIYGDLCLGRNGLILKWLLEGEWVNRVDVILGEVVLYNNRIDLQAGIDKIRTPMDRGYFNDPTFFEPTHIPRLEGLEWGCLEDFALNKSGARIRIRGDGLGDVPVHDPTFLKKIHNVAKAGIRAIFGKLLATEKGNKLMLDTSREHYKTFGCYTKTDDPDNVISANDFRFKACESFEEYVASQALLSVKQNMGLLTEADALLAYHMFRRKSDVGPQIKTEEEANEFILAVMDFIERLRNDPEVQQIYNDTIDYFNDRLVRDGNLTRCKNDYLPKYRPGGDKLGMKIPVRLYNNGYEKISNVPLALVHDHIEIKRMTADSLSGGESKYITKDENGEYIFKIHPVPQTGLHSIQLIADPDYGFSECNKANNYDGFYYYILEAGMMSPPDTPNNAFRPPPPASFPDPRASPECIDGGLVPPNPGLQLITIVNGQYDISVKAGADVTLQWIIRNTGNVPLNNIVVNCSLPNCPAVSFPGVLSPGDQTVIENAYTVPLDPKLYIGIGTVQAEYIGANLQIVNTGVASAYIKINAIKTCDIAIISIHPNPNPEISEVMLGGTLYRYYRVMDVESGTPIAGATVKAEFSTVIGIVTRTYTTNADGYIISMGAGPDEKGMDVPWDIWPVGIISSSPQVEGKLTVEGTCAEPWSFSIKLLPKTYSRNIRGGTAIGAEASILTLGLGGKVGFGLDITLPGSTDGVSQTDSSLSAGRTISGEVAGKLKYELVKKELNIGGAGAKMYAGLGAGVSYSLTYDDRHDFEFPLNLERQLAIALLMIHTGTYGFYGVDPLTAFVIQKLIERVGGLDGYLSSYGEMGGWKVSASAGATARAGWEFGPSWKLGLGLDAGASLDLAVLTGRRVSPLRSEESRILDYRAAFDARAILNLIPEVSSNPQLSRSVDKIKATYNAGGAGAWAGWAGGLKYAVTFDSNTGILKQVTITTSHRKKFGYQELGGQPVNLGDGNQYLLRFNSSDPDKMAEAISRIQTLTVLAERSPTLVEAILGPTRFMNELVEAVKVLDNYDQTVQKGSGYQLPFGLSLVLAGTGFEIKANFNLDRSLDYAVEKGVIKQSEMYVLQKYPVDDPNLPPLLLSGLIDSVSNAFDAVKTAIVATYRFVRRVVQIGAGAVLTLIELFFSPSGVQLLIDGSAETEPLEVELIGIPYTPIAGPVQPGVMHPYDIAGSADKPHNGIGGFFQFLPNGRILMAPAQISIHYEDSEVVNLDENSLAIYKWNSNNGEWDYIGGVVDTMGNKVTGDITELGLYTLAPAMPAGKVEWPDQIVTIGTNSSGQPIRRINLTSGPILMNNGNPVPPGTRFHAIIGLADAYAGADGFIVMDERQVGVGADGKIHLEVEIPDIVPAVRLLVFSDVGTAQGDHIIGLQ
jgi:hypothetical protein